MLVCLLLCYDYSSQMTKHIDLDFSFEEPLSAVRMLVGIACKPLFDRWHISPPTLANVMCPDLSAASLRIYFLKGRMLGRLPGPVPSSEQGRVGTMRHLLWVILVGICAAHTSQMQPEEAKFFVRR